MRGADRGIGQRGGEMHRRAALDQGLDLSLPLLRPVEARLHDLS